jgi:hypothetical protein
MVAVLASPYVAKAFAHKAGRAGAFQRVNLRSGHSQTRHATPHAPQGGAPAAPSLSTSQPRERCARKSNIVVSHEGTKARRREPPGRSAAGCISCSRPAGRRERERACGSAQSLRAFVPSCENFGRAARIGGDAPAAPANVTPARRTSRRSRRRSSPCLPSECRPCSARSPCANAGRWFPNADSRTTT